MSNRASFAFTKFANLSDDGGVIDESYGYRLYDDYEAVYNNCFDSFDELTAQITKNSIVDYISENHSSFNEVIRNGMYFNNVWLTPEDLGTDGDDDDEDDDE